MKQNRELQNQALISENLYDDGNDLWFTEFDYNALFKVNKTNLKIKFIGCFPEENFMQERLYASTALYNGKLYFAPYTANDIAVFDIKKETFIKLNIISESKKNCTIYGNTKFFRTLAIENEIYFIPDHYPGILCYNIKENKFTCFNDWINTIEKIRVNNWGYFTGIARVQNKFVLSCACADAVLIFDILTKQAKVMPMKNHDLNHDLKDICEYSGICYVNEYFYLISGDGIVIKRKLESEDEEMKIIQLPVSYEDVVAFYPVQFRNGFLYLFPYGQNKCFKIDVKTEEVIEEKIFKQELYQGKNFPVLSCIDGGNYLYLFTGNQRSFIEYDDLTKKIFKWKLYLSNKDKMVIKIKKEKNFIQQMYKEKMFIENNQYSLSYMLGVLQFNTECRREKEENYKGGDKIYRNIKSSFCPMKGVPIS